MTHRADPAAQRGIWTPRRKGFVRYTPLYWRCPVAIPAFDDTGQLPPGTHAARWDEVVARYGGDERRRALLDGLERLLALLAAVGCRRVWLNGSFVSSKVAPGDFDLAWDLGGVDLEALRRRDLALDPLVPGRMTQLRRYGGECFAVSEPVTSGVVATFRHDRLGREKGIVLIALAPTGRAAGV